MPEHDLHSRRSAEAAEVRANALRRTRDDPEGLLAEYTRRFGNILNADNAAELFPEYAASRASRAQFRPAVHPAAQWVRDELFARALKDPKIGEVIFTAGGNGAGKSTGGLTGDVVMDTTLSNPEYSEKLIEAAVNAGKSVHVVYTYRPIEQAFEGVLDRARLEGRTVSIGTLIGTHQGAADTVRSLAEKYAGHPDVRFWFIDNSGANPVPGSIALTWKQDYLESREQLYAILESQRAQIPEYIYQAAQGTDYGRARRSTGPAGRAQPEASGAAETETSSPPPEVAPTGEPPSPKHGEALHSRPKASSAQHPTLSTPLRALVVGLEKSGLASIQVLLQHGANVRATDVKPLAQMPEAAATLERLGVAFAQQSDAVFEGCELIVVSPGVPADLAPLGAARQRGVRVIGEVELAAPFLKGRTIGITGTNGKTTTTSLVGHILRESGIAVQVGGNIGTPVTAMIDSSRADQWNVLELSSFQLETIAEFHADIAVALNVTQNHLDRHHTFANYAAAKGRLFETQRSGAFAILNADDATCVGYAALTAGRPLWFSSTRAVTPGVWLEDNQIRFDGEVLMDAREIPIRGRHNIENTMAAAAATRLAGASLASIAAAVRTFKAVEHRLEFVRNLNGVDFYNDSKATSVDASLKALDAFSGGLWVILGGKDKGLDYTVLRQPLAAKAHAALLIGAAAPKIAEQLHGAVPLEHSQTLDNAVRFAYTHARPGDTVLLAPACASFDQFTSYEHRGQVFKSLVQQLEPGHEHGATT
ncbi:MAG: UDP-N-acetylmuramoyl-L-alanine--D-glutamate ligase [Bryobacteraceae bacterium]|jgi:UDP-N-acetylmuramoylalanine--D-glutamate ligase